MNPKMLNGMAFGVGVTLAVVMVAYAAYEAGYANGRHSMPMALEPLCVEVRQAGRRTKVVCPDSLGRLDYGQR